MTISITRVLFAAIVGVIVWIIARQIPYASKKPLPVLLGFLAALAAYYGVLILVA